MAKEREKFDVGLGVKIQKTTQDKLTEMAEELFPGRPGAYSDLVREIIAKALTEHEQAKKRK
jgi:hypothetical protein